MAKPLSTHEDLSTHFELKTSSERSFGVVFAAVFAVVALLPLRHGLSPRWWALGVAGVFLLAGLLAPAVLRPLNIVWTRLGLLLAKVVNPIVMAILFYAVVTPVGLLRRVFAGRSIPIGKDEALGTYWIERKPPGPPPESMADQF